MKIEDLHIGDTIFYSSKSERLSAAVSKARVWRVSIPQNTIMVTTNFTDPIKRIKLISTQLYNFDNIIIYPYSTTEPLIDEIYEQIDRELIHINND